MLFRPGRFRLFLPSFRLQRVANRPVCLRLLCFMNLKFSRLIAFECRAYGARIIGIDTPALPESTQTPTLGRVPHVRSSVPGLNTIVFECFNFICKGVIGGVKALVGASPVIFNPCTLERAWRHPSRDEVLVGPRIEASGRFNSELSVSGTRPARHSWLALTAVYSVSIWRLKKRFISRLSVAR